MPVTARYSIRHGRYFGVKSKEKGKILPIPWYNTVPEPKLPEKEQMHDLLCKCMNGNYLWQKDHLTLAKKLIKQGLLSVKRNSSSRKTRKKHNIYTTTEKGILYR